MTAPEIKNKIFANYSVSSDSGKTADQKKKVEQCANEVASVLARLDSALAAEGLGGVSIRSGYRSTAKLRELWNKNTGGGKHKANPATAAPGSSAHEWGGAVDVVSLKGKFGDFVKFSMKWFAANNIDFDQLIDESSGGSNGWLHVGLSRKGSKTENRHAYAISWGGGWNQYASVSAYIDARNKKTGEKTTGGNAASDGLGNSDGSSLGVGTYTDSGSGASSDTQQSSGSGWNGKAPGAFDPSNGVKEMTAEEIEAAKKLKIIDEQGAYDDAVNNAYDEYAALLKNSIMSSSHDGESPTEDEIILYEALIEEYMDSMTFDSYDASPIKDQEIAIDSATNINSQYNIIDLTNSDDNTSLVNVNNTSSNTYHTRIYKMFDASIIKDELSMLDDCTTSIIDQSTGLHIDTTYDGHNDEPPADTLGSPHSTNVTKTIGNVAPLIRINDAYYANEQIVSFKLYSTDFIPTISLELNIKNQDILKDNAIKDGDICSVFIQSGNDMVKSYRGDYKITDTNMKKIKSNSTDLGVSIKVFGELYIPTLYSGENTFSYVGTSMEAALDIAERLKLGLFFCDEENTNDTQVWHSIARLNKKNKESQVEKYIKKITLHAYKNPNAFYDSWIDPRYGLCFLNINKLLGEDGLDENVDMAFFNNAMTNSIAVTGNNIDEDSSKKYNQPMAKILTNISADAGVMSEFFIIDYKENINNNISDSEGLFKKMFFNIKNSGVNKNDNKVEFKASLCVNKTKLENGFAILAGPGENLTYKQADNGDYTEQHTTVLGGEISSIQSDVDAESMASSKSNMSASGNVHKFYKVAKAHNDLNNKQLEKKTLTVTLNGKNLLMTRGEKIPVLLIKGRGALNDIAQLADDTTPPELQLINEVDSGWFIIKDLTWVYNANKKEGNTFWETILTLTRREWPIPGYTNQDKKDEEEGIITVTNDLSDATIKESKSDKVVDTSTGTDTSNSPTAGLTSRTLDLWNIINNVAAVNNKTVLLVGARRWAADANGNRVEGEPTIKNGNVYKFVNSKGNVLWFSDKTSQHLYGNAIDIINGSGTTYDEVIKLILDSLVLAYLLTNGMYGANEMSLDDTGNTVKHFHLGLANSSTDESMAKWWLFVQQTLGTNLIYYGSETYIIDMYEYYYNNSADYNSVRDTDFDYTIYNEKLYTEVKMIDSGGGSTSSTSSTNNSSESYSGSGSSSGVGCGNVKVIDNNRLLEIELVNGFSLHTYKETFNKQLYPMPDTHTLYNFVSQAAFTTDDGSRLYQGYFVSDGVLYFGDTKSRPWMHGVILYYDGSHKFFKTHTDYVNEIKSSFGGLTYKASNKKIKSAFLNYLSVNNGKPNNIGVDGTCYYFRHVCEKDDGKLYMVVCLKARDHSEFRNTLLKLGYKNALYMDAAANWQKGWYRLKSGEESIIPKNIGGSIDNNILYWCGKPVPKSMNLWSNFLYF